MAKTSEPRLYYRPLPKATVAACGVIIAVVSILALIGWFRNVPMLQGLVPGSPPMPYLSAVGFLLAGVGLLALARQHHWLSVVCGLPLALGAGYMLTEYSLWAGLGRAPLMQYLPLPAGITETSQQSPLISLGLCMTGAALLRLPFIIRSRAGVRELDMVTGFLFGVACAGIVAYQTAETVEGRWTSVFAMPVTVTANFMLIAIALHAASPHQGMRNYDRSEMRLPVLITVSVAGIGLGIWSLLRLAGLDSLGASLTVVGLLISVPLASQVAETWIRRMLVPEPVNTEGSFRALVESMGEGVLVCNRKAQVTLTNPAIREMFGLAPLEHRNQGLGKADDEQYCLYLPHSDTAISWQDSPLSAALAGKAAPAADLMAGKDPASRRTLRIVARPVKSGKDKIIGAILTATDITTHKRDEAALKRYAETMARNSRELEQITYISAHHLQEPIRDITSYAQLLEREIRPALNMKSAEYLRYLVMGAQRLKEQQEDLLAYLDLGARKASLRPVSMEEVVKDCITALGEQARDAVRMASPLPTVMGDRQLLSLLVKHLLGNALKFNRSESPRVEITALQAGDDWQFSVSDNGIGVLAEHSTRIFDLFQKLHLQEEYPGTGMGLALCSRIVALHGGRIWHEPARGGGSIFHFRLPMTPQVREQTVA